MQLQTFIKVVLAIALLAFIYLSVNQIRNDREVKQIQRIEIKSNEAKLIELENKYNEVLDLKSNTEAEKQEKQKRIEELENERQRLERELQAKLHRQAEEKKRLATASVRASGGNVASAQSAGSGNCESYRHLVAQYDWNVDTMMRAMRLESSCNPNAVGDTRVIGGIYAPSCGLLQVRTLPGRPSCDQLKNPAFNIQTAYNIWKGQGYRAWTVLH